MLCIACRPTTVQYQVLYCKFESNVGADLQNKFMSSDPFHLRGLSVRTVIEGVIYFPVISHAINSLPAVQYCRPTGTKEVPGKSKTKKHKTWANTL